MSPSTFVSPYILSLSLFLEEKYKYIRARKSVTYLTSYLTTQLFKHSVDPSKSNGETARLSDTFWGCRNASNHFGCSCFWTYDFEYSFHLPLAVSMASGLPLAIMHAKVASNWWATSATYCANQNWTEPNAEIVKTLWFCQSGKQKVLPRVWALGFPTSRAVSQSDRQTNAERKWKLQCKLSYSQVDMDYRRHLMASWLPFQVFSLSRLRDMMKSGADTSNSQLYCVWLQTRCVL